MKKNVAKEIGKRFRFEKISVLLNRNTIIVILIIATLCVCLTVNSIVRKRSYESISKQIIQRVDDIGQSQFLILENAIDNVMFTHMYGLDEDLYQQESLKQLTNRYTLYTTLRFQSEYLSSFDTLVIYDENSGIVYDNMSTVVNINNYFDQGIRELAELNKDHAVKPLDRLNTYFRYAPSSNATMHITEEPTMTAILSGRRNVHFLLNINLNEFYREHQVAVRKLYDVQTVLVCNTVIAASDIEMELAETMLNELQKDSIGMIWSNENDLYRVMKTESDALGLTFYTLISEEKIDDMTATATNEILFLQVFSFIIYSLLFLGSLLLFITPIRKLLKKAVQRKGERLSMEEMLSELIQEKDELTRFRSDTTSFLTANLLIELLKGYSFDADYLRQTIKSYEIKLCEGAYYTCAVEIGISDENIVSEEMSLIKGLIVSQYNNMLEGIGFAVDLKGNLIGIACNCIKSRKSFEEQIRCINQTLISKFENNVTIAVGPDAIDLFNLKPSFDSAVSALDYRISFNGGEVIDCEQFDLSNELLTDFFNERHPQILKAMCAGEVEKAQQMTDELFEYIESNHYRISVREIEDTLIYLLQSVYSTCESARIFVTWEHSLYGLYRILKGSSLQELKILITEIIVTAARSISSSHSSVDEHRSLVARKACTYIEENYSMDVSLNEVAEHVNLSPQYLSSIFKESVGMSFSTYLEKVRLEAAEKLLRDSILRVSQVAEAVGFRSSSYFSKVFRKRMGMSPEQYRNITDKRKNEIIVEKM